ncbi:MAG: hypothetical protein SGARI_007503, partial [Bacillariaceae sp.]
MKSIGNLPLALAISVMMGVSSTTASVVKGPYPDGVPGSGFGCDNSCNSGDVNYVIKAKLAEYTVSGSSESTLSSDGEDVGMFTRTFEGVPELSSPFCQDGYDGTEGPIGPCITVNPGQTMNIKIVNDMKDGMEVLQQHRAEL